MGINLDEGSGPGMDPLQRAAMAYGALDARLRAVEAKVGEIPQLTKDVGDIKTLVTDVKSVLRHMLSKGILLVLGGIGGTYGVTKATEDKPAAVPTVVQRSAFDRGLDACRQLQGGDAQGECIARVIREQMGPR